MKRSSSIVRHSSPQSDGESDDGHTSKKRRVTFESNVLRSDQNEGNGHHSKSRTGDSGHVANAGDASDEQHRVPVQESISVSDDHLETETPRRGRKRSKSNAGLPAENAIVSSEPTAEDGPRKSKKRSKSSPDSEHPDATEAARTDKRRSRSKTTRSPSRSRSARPEASTAVESPVNKHNTSDTGRDRVAANNVKRSSLGTEVSGDSGASVSKVPQSHTVTSSKKSSM